MIHRRLNKRVLLFVAFLLAAPLTVQAQVVALDQSKALAGNITPGDAPGFPISINRPGSYRLTGAITTAAANEIAVEVNARDVTLDLAGFTIKGPVTCSATPNPASITCLPATGVGVLVSSGGSLTLHSGSIRGFGVGVDASASSEPNGIRDLSITEVTNWGVRGGSRTDVYRTTVHAAQGSGMSGAGVFDGNSVSFIAGVGIRPADGAVLRHNRVIRAATNGILGLGSAIFFATGNVIQQSPNQAGSILNAVSPAGGNTNFCNGQLC